MNARTGKTRRGRRNVALAIAIVLVGGAVSLVLLRPQDAPVATHREVPTQRVRIVSFERTTMDGRTVLRALEEERPAVQEVPAKLTDDDLGRELRDQPDVWEISPVHAGILQAADRLQCRQPLDHLRN